MVFESAFLVARAVVAATCDFAFMAHSALASLVLVFAPALASVYAFHPSNALAYLLAMRLPHLFLAVVFAVRLRRNVGRMKAGEPGPWSAHAGAATA
jgi:hypothetical protein